jgi:hypothetical protein
MNGIISGCVLLLMFGSAQARELKLDAVTTLAVVPVKNGNIDQKVYRQFDLLVPRLKKISNKKIVKLEYRCSGRIDQQQEVEDAYTLAARIEKYLRVQHKLDLDLWIAIKMQPPSKKATSVLTMAVFPDEIKKLDAILIKPASN